MEEAQLRPATPDDALALAVLASQVFIDTYAPDGISAKIAREVTQTFAVESMARLLTDDTTQVVVAEQRGHLQGFAQWRRGAFATLPDLPSAEVQRLYVLRSFAGHGLGSRLLARCEQDAQAAGASQVWLTAWVENSRALGFYPRLGYVDSGKTQYVFEDETFENRVLVKRLR